MTVYDAFKIGSKIYGGIAKTIGTCVIFYAALCAVVLVSAKKKSQQNSDELSNDKMVEVRSNIVEKAEKHAAEDRRNSAQKVKNEKEPLNVITAKASKHKA